MKTGTQEVLAEVNLQELKDELLDGFKQYLDSQDSLCEDNIAVMRLMPKLLQLQNDKGKVYGRSYAKHGDVSIFFNVERKFDRISTIMDRAIKEGVDTLYGDQSATPTETFMDTVVDLGMYGLMWAGYIASEHPEICEQFLSLNKLQ